VVETSPDYLTIAADLLPYAVVAALGWWTGSLSRRLDEMKQLARALMIVICASHNAGQITLSDRQKRVLEEAKEYLR
jgi:hypothetical protein